MDAATPLTPGQAAALLRGAAAALRAELVALPPAAAAWHPAAGAWCAKEVVGHLIEAEQRGFAGRIRQLLESPGEPRFTEWDPAAVARGRGDCARSLEGLLDDLATLREASARLVDGLGEPDLARGGYHPRVGRLTVRDLLHEWIHHDRNHLKQLLANVQAFVWPHLGNAQRFSSP